VQIKCWEAEQKFQPDICFVIKPAKRYAFFTQVLRQFLLRKKHKRRLN